LWYLGIVQVVVDTGERDADDTAISFCLIGASVLAMSFTLNRFVAGTVKARMKKSEEKIKKKSNSKVSGESSATSVESQ